MWITVITNFFPSFQFSMKNSVQEIVLLILFQIDFLSICILQISKSILKTWMILHLEHCQTPLLLLLYLIPVLKTKQLHQSCTFIYMTDLLSRQFTKQSMLQLLKLNCLPFNVVLTKWLVLLTLIIQSSLWIPSMLPKEFLILYCTHTKFILWQFLMNLETSS